MYGDSMQAMVPGYLDASMDSFRRNQEQFKSAVEGAFASSPFANTPFAELAKRNMAMFEAAAQAFKPGAKPGEATATAASKDDEIAALKAELGRLNDKIEKLGK
jgi:polyhydroxyalkanoate synthesis regulator protein